MEKGNEKYDWEPLWMGAEEFGQYMDKQYEELETLMEEIGF